MLPRSTRLPRALFSEILKSRRFVHSPNFSLRIGSPTGKTVRIAVSVSKKVSKSAVVRNSVRRRAYSALVPLLPSIPAGLYLFMAKPSAEKIKGRVLEDEMRALLKAAERS